MPSISIADISRSLTDRSPGRRTPACYFVKQGFVQKHHLFGVNCNHLNLIIDHNIARSLRRDALSLLSRPSHIFERAADRRLADSYFIFLPQEPPHLILRSDREAIEVCLKSFSGCGRDIARSAYFSKARPRRRVFKLPHISLDSVYMLNGVMYLGSDEFGLPAKKKISDCFGAKEGV